MTIPSDETRQLITLRHRGASWEACADALGRSARALRMKATRLRDAGEWLLADGRPARGAPEPGARGRPRGRASVGVSLRFSPGVLAAVRAVAESAGVREGELVTVALERATARATGRRVVGTPLGLEPGAVVKLALGARSETLSVSVPKEVRDAFVATLAIDAAPTAGMAQAVRTLLRELNFEFVRESR